MKAGDVVLYLVAGQTHKALVLQAHAGQPQLLGKNGEPLLHLAFLAPERESAIQRAKYGYIPQVFTEFDVVHHSQEFSDEQKKALGIQSPAQLAQQRGQGEWYELITAKPAIGGLVRFEFPRVSTIAGESAPLEPPVLLLGSDPAAPPLRTSPIDVFAQPDQVPDPNPTQE